MGPRWLVIEHFLERWKTHLILQREKAQLKVLTVRKNWFLRAGQPWAVHQASAVRRKFLTHHIWYQLFLYVSYGGILCDHQFGVQPSMHHPLRNARPLPMQPTRSRTLFTTIFSELQEWGEPIMKESDGDGNTVVCGCGTKSVLTIFEVVVISGIVIFFFYIIVAIIGHCRSFYLKRRETAAEIKR